MYQTLERSLNYAKGHQSFKNLYFNLHEKEFLSLVENGQSPKTLFIGCSDSRVIPELITSTRPGELFVIRNAGNFVSQYDPKISWDGVAATIQYAVEVLGVTDVIVCGHSHCGAIQALFAKPDKTSAVNISLVEKWLQWGQNAKALTLANVNSDTPREVIYGVCERLSVMDQLEHLLTYNFIKEKVESNKLFLHGWHFTIESGEVEFFNPTTYQFEPIHAVLKRQNQETMVKKQK